MRAQADKEARERQQREREQQLKAQAEREQQLRAQAEREQQLRAQAERESQQRAEAESRRQAEVAARGKARAEWVDRVRAKIKGNLVIPPDMAGNPQAEFEVVQLPTGEIIDVRLRRSSGVRAYDDAVQRAILKSSPLPRPANPEDFTRELTLRFRPVD
jgi:colicin import membrane protein